jgi:hypothetical protein
MEWITNHLRLAFGAIATLAVIAAYFRKPALAAWRLYRRAQAEIDQTQERLADGYQGLTTLTERERDRARQECEELRRDLGDAVRAKDLRDDINRQDRALIRALKTRLRKNQIDFSDIEESVQRQFENE